MVHDFRSVYASVLSEWFGVSDAEIATTLLNSYPTLPIIKATSGVAPASSPVPGPVLMQNYPNPCAATTTINFRTLGGRATLRIFGVDGTLAGTLLDDNISAGEKTIAFDTRALASGTYIYRLEAGGMGVAREMVVER
jgi:hypothetical protein